MFPILWLRAAHAEPEMIPLEVFEAAKQLPSAEAPIVLALRDGGTFDLAAERGRYVVLSFWASWCAPCRQELPALAIWAHGHPDVRVVTVNVDRTRPSADRFLASVAFDLPVAFDPDATHFGRYGVQAMPTMFLYDPDGRLVWQHAGYNAQTGFTELDAALGGAR